MTTNRSSVVELGVDSKAKQVDREKLNVNSPRGAGTKNMFGSPASLITQVNPDDAKGQKELAKRLAGRVDHHEESDQEIVSSEQSPRASSVSKFSCWLCCGSCTSKDEHIIVKSDGDSAEKDNDNKLADAESSTDLVVETKIMDEDDEVNDEVDPKDEQNATELADTESNGLLSPVSPADHGRKCLVLDLDETLVHSSFQKVDCSFNFPIELDGLEYEVYVSKRPFVDEFIAECAKVYELVIFTASLSEYANPVIDTLDPNGYIKHRLFREHCVFHENQVYVKDLSTLGRNIKDCIIIDNSPLSYLFDPTNAIGCTSWFGDPKDTELRDLLPVLNGQLLVVNDVRTMLDANTQSVEWLIKQYGDKNKKTQISTTE